MGGMLRTLHGRPSADAARLFQAPFLFISAESFGLVLDSPPRQRDWRTHLEQPHVKRGAPHLHLRYKHAFLVLLPPSPQKQQLLRCTSLTSCPQVYLRADSLRRLPLGACSVRLMTAESVRPSLLLLAGVFSSRVSVGPRTYVTVDIILRALREYFGVHAWHVLNITDVDDKIIKRVPPPVSLVWRVTPLDPDLRLVRQSNEAGVPALELSQKFEREFFRDLTALGVEPPSTVLRVSEHIDEVLSPSRNKKKTE